MENPLLRIDSLGKKNHQKIILDAVSFSLKKGEILLIKGASGCGKTTLLRCLALLEKIDSGQIIFNGEIISCSSYKNHPSEAGQLGIGMVFQHLYLWPHLTVLENVSLPLWLRNGKNKEQANDLARQKLSILGLDSKTGNYPSQLSGGQRQRAALARALVHSQKLLLLDEITTNLDSQTAQRVIEEVQRIAERGTSVILVTHSIPVETFGSRILCFDETVWKIESFKGFKGESN